MPETAGSAVAGSARERILETAYDMFSRPGIRAVGVDTIIARSGVAKMSLYRHFASKDQLVLEFLQGARAALERAVAGRPGRGTRRGRRRPAARDLRRLRRVVPAGGLRGLLVHQRAARVRRDRSPSAAGLRHPSREHTRHARGVRRPGRGVRSRSPGPEWHLLMKGSIVAAGEGDRQAARRAQELGRLLLEHETAG